MQTTNGLETVRRENEELRKLLAEMVARQAARLARIDARRAS